MSLKKIPYQTGQQLLACFTASDEAHALVTEPLGILETIELLDKEGLHFDLMQFIAHGLPVRESIWWASLCLNLRNNDWHPNQIQAIELCQSWVKKPDEVLRRRIELMLNKMSLNCGPSWLLQAVFWNGSGSIVAPSLPAVMPDPHLYAKATAGAVNMAAALPDWQGQVNYYQQATATAINIANGGNGQQPS
ncbi:MULTISPECIES: Twin-arginine translocation pathway signal [unclassified Motilimonas]|uniref:DUF6931 family protein n=1 Tax=Motilimonas TaxID=1914248 RepID=UPI001E64D366|nr:MULTISPECIES: Twin-arginine translocation pathway signal [unclassified Motilimonas]MCE0557545.1 Twin-arginine translocation pathway signal [Motilimonas sp. E26]MDO6524571.1 Twin-arginine translocation pathway signal [Motilimonas sp. 1_MG-2023]